jgi:hypothetical protein
MDRVIDYAGLFPPAGLDMRQTVRNYAEYTMHPCSFALSRLVVPAARLDELDEEVASLRDNGNQRDRWPLSVLIGDDWRADLGDILALGNGRAARDAFVIDAVEVKAPADLDDVVRIRRAIPERATAFFEIPIDDDPVALVGVIGAAGASAKARTGGVEESAFPTTDQIARFMECCRRNAVAFKLTAGLHHPLRSVHRLTYEADSARATMHGFLNAFVAASLVFAGFGQKEANAALEESSADVFQFEDDSVVWRSRRLAIDQIAQARAKFAISFGSCSFEEPIEDLKGIDLL